MTTAYNLRNAMAKSSNVDRSSRADPGSGNIIIVSQVDRGICEMTGAGTRTLETAVGIGLGTKILCISRTNAILVAGATTVTINDGEYVEFVVTKDTAGVHQWVENGGTSEAGLAARVTTAEADIVVAEGDIDALEGQVYGLRTVKLDVTDARVHDAQITRLPAAGATDDLGIVIPTIGSINPPVLSALNDAGGTLVQEGVIHWVVPDNYVAAGAISLSVDWARTDNADTSADLDVTVFRANAASTDIAGAASPDTEINDEASNTTTWALTATNIVPGEILLINLIATIVDGASTSLFTFEPEMIYTVVDGS